MKKSNRLRDRKPQSGRKKRRGIVAFLVLFALVFAQFSSTGLTASVQAADEDEAVEAAADTGKDTLDVEIDDETIEAESETEEESPAAVEDEAGEKSEAETEDETPEEEEEEEDKEEAATYEVTKGGVTVTVEAPAGALPEDAKLQVKRYDEDSSEYKEAAEAIDFDENESGMAALDISFTVDGEEVEPEEAVKVSIDASKILPEDADASTLEVQHLKEGRAGQVRAEVVANDSKETEGTIDEAKATAEFEVESFSTFTVEWNDDTDATITVHVYNINGTSIDEELDEFGYSGTGGVISIDELVSHLEQNASYTSTYSFAYATIYYETTNNQGGFDPGTIGDENNSVTQITKSGTNYTVTYGGSSTTLNDPYVVTIHLYYSLPTVTLTATENTDGTVGFTTESSYFTGDTSSAEYHWALSDDSYGSITPGGNGTATFTWSEDAVPGDQVSVTVTMTVGDETASDTYTLTYGTESTTITVTLNGTTQANANVALVDENENTVATGKTGDDGTITLNVAPGTYTVGVTYVTYNSTGGGSTTRYTNSGTVTVAEDGTITGDTTVDLTSSVSSGPGGDTNGSGSTGWSEDGEYYYEHIDVKVAVAEGAEADAVFSDLDRVYVYDEYGNLIYYSLDLVENDDTTDYNGLFDVNGSEGHSLVVSSKDTIILVFEVYENGEYRTYTETITPSATYPEGEYYSYSDVNAYQLYNSINGTNISESDWETALNNGTLQTLLGNNYNENGIAIGGMSFIQVADYLCDTRGTSGQAGLDFVIDVGLISVLYETYDLQIAKSLEGVPDYVTSVEGFEFTLQELSSVSDSTDYTEAIWNTQNALGEAASATTGEWTKEADGTWSAIADFEDFLEYEAEDGTTLFYYVLSEKDSDSATAEVQYYGVKVSVEYSSSTGIATVTASYCELVETDEEGVYNRDSGWTGLTAYTGVDEDGGEYTYFSIPFINLYSSTPYSVDVYKYDSTTNEPLEDVTFILWRISDGEEEAFADFTYDEVTGVNTVSAWIPADTALGNYNYQIYTDEEGYIHIAGLEPGDYWLEEEDPLEGYKRAEEPFSFTVNEDGTVTSEYWSDDMSAIAIPNDEEIINVRKTDSNGNPLEGAEFVMGRIEQNEINISIPIEGTNYHYEYLTFTEDTETGTYILDQDEGVDTRDEATTLVTDEDGYIHLRELDTGALYFLVETKAPDGYTAVKDPIVFWVDYDGNMTLYLPSDDEHVSASDDTITVIDNLITVDISGSKTWMNDEENDRPESITVYLFADGEQVMDENGNAVTATATADDWTWSFTDLPKYQSDGETEIVYTVLEGEITGTDSSYIPTYDYETDEDGNITVVITNAIPEVHKVVSDPAYGESTDDGLHADEADNNDILEYRMEADHIGGAHNLVLHDFLGDQLDLETLVIKSVTLYTSEEDEDGTVLEEGIDYDASIGECSAPDCGLEGCSFEIHVYDEDVQNLSADAYVIVIFDVEVKEGVEDFNDSYVDEVDNWVGLSFVAYNVWTYADEPEPGYGTPEETQTYSYGFDLYKYDADTSEPLAGVEFVMSNSNGKYAQFEVTDNTYLLTGWVDSKDDATAIVTGSDGNAVVEGLHDGTFSIEETKAPEGYQKKTGTMTVTITVNEDDPLNPTITATNADVDGLEAQISNTPGEDMIEIIGSKTWDDGDDADGVRPGSIKIHLLADGEEVDSLAVTADDNWAWSFKNLPIYQDDGTTEIVYTITEDAVDDYDTTISNYNVTNTHEYEIRDISGSKTWDDDNDKADARPSSITVNLYQDGKLYDSKTVTEADDWAWRWTNLPKNANGKAITYSITEDEVEYYDTTYNSGNFDITNTFIGEEGPEHPDSGTNHGGNNPKTGDTNNLGTWLTLLIVSLACALVAFRMRKRS